jgi:hypothetical protein
MSKEDEKFVEIKEHIFLALTKDRVWSAPESVLFVGPKQP